MTLKNKTALVTGGAGYIGSHCLLSLKEAGWDAVVIDNLSTGHKEAVLHGELIVGDIGDGGLLDEIFTTNTIDAVLHFAASVYVGESVRDPAKYYRNNTVNGLTLLEAMARHDVKNLVFSSTCAVYGVPERIPIDEDHPKNPISPYGYSKMVFERMATDFSRSSGIRPVFLRYFNATGADPEGRLGKDCEQEEQLVPLVLQTVLGKRDSLTIFGSDYPTADGTGVRDYVHVSDLASAHILALEYLANGGEPGAFNLGNGAGHSVRELIKTVEEVCGKPVNTIDGPRREGDPATLIGSSEKAFKTLGWSPKYADLKTIVETSYRWSLAHPNGY